MKVKLIDYTEGTGAIVAVSRCYDSEPKYDYSTLVGCYKSGHTAALEGMVFQFQISGISRTCLAQLTRHRIASYMVRSQRYCSEDDADCVLPPSIAQNEEARAKYNAAINAAFDAYRAMKELGIPQEDARYVLPNATETELVMTINLRSLINFCNLRMCQRAQWEIRELAFRMKEAVVELFPFTDTMLVPQCEKNASFMYCPEARGCGLHPKMKEAARRLAAVPAPDAAPNGGAHDNIGG